MNRLRLGVQSIRSRLCAGLLLSIAAFLVIAPFAPAADAHAGDQSYLYLVITNDVNARLEMPFGDVEKFLGIDLAGTQEETAAKIDENADALWDYARDHVNLGPGDGTEWELDFQGAARIETIDYVGVTFKLPVSSDELPQKIEILLDPFFDELPGRDALFLIGTDWSRGYIDNEADVLVRFTGDDRTQLVDLGESSQWANFSASVPIGLDHIRTGVDHILFVVVLVLPAVLVFRESSWQPVEGFGTSLWRVLKIVTMFTVSHSITFTLAGLGIVPTPSARIVETIIAASIAFAALHNLRPVIPEKEWIIAFVFGLFHGFGFASLVAELDVGTTTQLVSLLGRNLGIEIGQALVVLLVFPGLFLLRRTTAYQPFFVVSSVALVLASIGWMTERLFDAPAATSVVLNEIFAFPRVLLGVAALTVASIVLYQLQDRRGELRSTSAR